MKAIKKYVRMEKVTNEPNSITKELHNHVEGAGGKGDGLSKSRSGVLTRYSKAKD